MVPDMEEVVESFTSLLIILNLKAKLLQMEGLQVMAALALEQGWLRFHQLKVGEKVIAAMYCFRYRDTLYAYQIGFDSDWASYSPGRLLIAHVIQEAINEGIRELDWLSGADAYKFAWTDQARTDSHLIFGKNWRGNLWCLGTALLEAGKPVVRERLPQPLREQINLFVSMRRR